jgi:chromosome partitioning protein
MKVLGLLSRKGGVGKTSMAIHLSVLAQESGKRVLLIDLDPQGSAAAWWQAREASVPQLEATTPDKLSALLDAARANGIDLAIIDTRPSAEADAVQVAALSDYLLIPTRPAIMDLRAILSTLDIVKGGRHRASIVLNACLAPRGVGEASSTSEARLALKAFGVPVAPVSIGQRLGGLGITEADPSSKATKEIRALWRYVEKELSK